MTEKSPQEGIPVQEGVIDNLWLTQPWIRRQISETHLWVSFITARDIAKNFQTRAVSEGFAYFPDSAIATWSANIKGLMVVPQDKQVSYAVSFTEHTQAIPDQLLQILIFPAKKVVAGPFTFPDNQSYQWLLTMSENGDYSFAWIYVNKLLCHSSVILDQQNIIPLKDTEHWLLKRKLIIFTFPRVSREELPSFDRPFLATSQQCMVDTTVWKVLLVAQNIKFQWVASMERGSMGGMKISYMKNGAIADATLDSLYSK